MDKRLLYGLAGLGALGVAGYLARIDVQRDAPAAKRRAAPSPVLAREAPVVALIEPPTRPRLPAVGAPHAQHEESAPATAAEHGPAGDSNEPLVVVLYQHASHDPEFPGERWIIGAGYTDAGRAFRANEASAIEVPTGVVVTLIDTARFVDGSESGATEDRVEVGAGLHNLAPYGFNDRVDAVDVRRIESDDARDRQTYPAHVTLIERADGLASRLGRVWTLRLPLDQATRLFTAHGGDFEGGAVRGLWVPSQLEALLFAEPDGRGAAFVLGPGLYDLDHLGLTQRALSVRVLRIVVSSRR